MAYISILILCICISIVGNPPLFFNKRKRKNNNDSFF